MAFGNLGLNRLGTKDKNVSNAGAVEMSLNPGPRYTGADEKAAPGILTGAVITACLFKSTDLPTRIQIQNNDMTLYESTTGGGGVVSGDSSTISFLKARDPRYGFVMNSRAGFNNNMESVFELYGLPPEDTLWPNYIFIGRSGRASVANNTGYIELCANIVTTDPAATKNGSFAVSVSSDGANNLIPSLWAGDARNIVGSGPGIVAYVSGEGTGAGAIGHKDVGLTLYVTSTGTKIGGNMIPDAGGYTIGDGSNKLTFYGTLIACPLPTVPDALRIIEKIPEPTDVGDRGHFGDRLYFDDLTFPEEVLYEKDGKKEIEHTMMIGLLMKAVIELNQKVKDLESRLSL